MLARRRLLGWLVLGLWSLACASTGYGQAADLPEELQDWVKWATWDEKHRECPRVYNQADQPVCFWPGRLTLTAEAQQAQWKLEILAYDETWVPLPGSSESWPEKVRLRDTSVAVVGRDGVPSVKVPAGRHELSGEFRWASMPQRIHIPQQIGVVTLTVGGTAVAMPNWDAQGDLWLQRLRAEVTDKDLISAQVYRLLEDGNPLWLHTDIELTVSGKSREEELGAALPDGWQLSVVDSPIPVAVDDQGRVKVQVRAGKWTIGLRAFRVTDAREIAFRSDAQPIVSEELVAFMPHPEFRLAELDGMPPVDVAQTTFPDKWRSYPVFRWTTATPFRLVEKMRGMGLERPQGLAIARHFWLDEDGNAITYRDEIQGAMQQIWRLDAADGQELGAVRVGGQNQLITTNSKTGSKGFEVRTRNLSMEAMGRMNQTQTIDATGWQADADSLRIHFTLPPGWRMLALFGADNVDGDWLTAWTLLDLFLLLIFSLSVFRLWGIIPGLITFIAFGLAYHEPLAPRFSWLFLLMPVALLRVVPSGAAHRWLTVWKYIAAVWLALFLVPFIVTQVQSALFPQLEIPGLNYGFGGYARGWVAPQSTNDFEFDTTTQNLPADAAPAPPAGNEGEQRAYTKGDQLSGNARFQTSNLAYDAQAKIQTGPAQPDWTWNEIECVWRSPVKAGQQIRPILISSPVHRTLTIVRLVLLLVLAKILLGATRWPRGKRVSPAVATAVVSVFCLLTTATANAEIPDAETLEKLRERLVVPNDAFPQAAEISSVELRVAEGQLTMVAEIHTGAFVAVPLPGRLAAWSPVKVEWDGEGSLPVLRHDGYLWVSLPAGVHHVTVQGLMPDATEWEWTYALAPRRVTIDAADWNVTGVNANGVPEGQVFFARKQQRTEGEATYDRKDFQTLVAVDRHLEIGLLWQVRTEVTRLSAPGKAVSLRIPLLPGERVLSSEVEVRDGFFDVRLGAGENSFSWQSELPIGSDITLSSSTDASWVDRWHLVTSPVWNVATSGLAPIFEPQETDLIPVWHPWPGEQVVLSFNKPEPIQGETLTVQRVQLGVTLGSRQRDSRLKLELESSLGGDIPIELSDAAQISALQIAGQRIRIRRDGQKLIVPLKPGRQTVDIEWKSDVDLTTTVVSEPITLPVESANITSEVTVPENRWILWADGPLRGPAVRFWTIIVCAIIAALILGGIPTSPLTRISWLLLLIGLTQVHLLAALFVISWFFALAYRGSPAGASARSFVVFNLRQLFLIAQTCVVLIIFVFVVREGLLGDPEMFIKGNGSSANWLIWYAPRAGVTLPETRIVTVSVWYYHLLMLFWALWLAAALIGWLKWAWLQFSQGGMWRTRQPIVATIAE